MNPISLAEGDRRRFAIRSDAVYTMGPDGARPACVVIEDDRIVAVARSEDRDTLQRSGVAVIDVGDRPVVPGFIDPHAHMEVAARVKACTVDVRAPERKSIEDVLDTLVDARRDLVYGGWLVGEANLFFDQKLQERRFPTRVELDAVAVDLPVAIRAGGHLSILNTRALELAGIGPDYAPPDGSITGKPLVERAADGTATGVVREMDNLIGFPDLPDEDLEGVISTAIHDLFTVHGVTTIGEISETVAGLTAMEQLATRGALGARVGTYLWAPGTATLEDAVRWREMLPFAAVPNWFEVAGVKVFADGGYSAANAAVTEPYLEEHGGHHGEMAMSATQIARAARLTREAGLQLAIHANGDRAQEQVCAALAGIPNVPDGPHTRIEHAGNFLPDYDRVTAAWASAGIVISPQPVFLYAFGDFFPTYLGDYGRRGRFPFKRLAADGWLPTGSSDVWVGSETGVTDPLFGMRCAVTRRSFLGDVIDADQAVSIEEALRMYTVNAAKLMGIEHDRGTLEVGKRADIVVLSDVLSSNPDQLAGINCDDVVLGGRWVHRSGDSAGSEFSTLSTNGE